MGQKIHPKGFRIGTVWNWESRWFADKKQYKLFVAEDAALRSGLLKRLQPAGVITIEIERSINKINLILHVVRPGMVIGRGGTGLEELKKYILNTIMSFRKKQEIGKKANFKLDLKVEPVKEPYLSAYFVAMNVSEQIAKRLPHKRVVNFAMDKVMNSGARGVKIILSGRIGGAEIGRVETYKIGSMPLSTLREEIDFAAVPSLTKSGYVGIKVWICK